ncbi:hypothetical protein M979_1922 [Buttiauxella noackiae ATCC 51607]|uniref:Uncharacterized protein n=1 Tax=Buttiauxella noackiae ATCC 51607 TaxID=1354255 RepID=A0A1B7HQL6_9ENTR|nr:hypothetical protein [Buttiauxella noackiae]OAT17933.1 hypothetical protein M979_1922 [Buttiauxella noackiae ATCC 51607]
MDFTIGPAQPEHLGMLRAIELAAFETLRDAGAVTGQACASSLEELSDFSRNGLLLAAGLSWENGVLSDTLPARLWILGAVGFFCIGTSFFEAKDCPLG